MSRDEQERRIVSQSAQVFLGVNDGQGLPRCRVVWGSGCSFVCVMQRVRSGMPGDDATSHNNPTGLWSVPAPDETPHIIFRG
jgi:hypothetical protein